MNYRSCCHLHSTTSFLQIMPGYQDVLGQNGSALDSDNVTHVLWGIQGELLLMFCTIRVTQEDQHPDNIVLSQIPT